MFVELLNISVYAIDLYKVQKKIVKILEESGITYKDWNDLQHFLNEDINKALSNKQGNLQEVITYNDVITKEALPDHTNELISRPPDIIE